ncbi:(Fe-S)-binding protein [Terasakiella sp. SH-1]|uniref:(Fe-S)-binding protein n=1 Tax=Terasakiella sp. SH-1 TaxID=2560057 RepID=UPI00107310B3|nr:(Fe-S)-binding protein [Terasakiella sp. SH-1]
MSRTYPDKPQSVYFFGTCLVDLFYPKAGVAGIELIKREGVDVIFPQGQSCCGQPAFNSGHRDEAREVARAQLDLFPKNIPVVLPSGSCAGMMHKHYPELFEGDRDYDKACELASRVFELSDFLLNVLKVSLEDKGDPLKITWHGSCHSQREMGVREQPKELIKQLSNVELVELKREKECCGFGGTFAVRQPEISAAMVSDKVDDAEATGADKLISGDCGCMMNITGHMEHRSSDLSGQHLAEFLWERTNGDR